MSIRSTHTHTLESSVRSRQARYGFTLIELLVVITIIVVLLALLTPSLDRAIYQAELAQCAAHARGIGQGATMYAFEHSRRWPAAKAFEHEDDPPGDTYAGSPDGLGREDQPSQDRRLVLDGYVPLGLHADPLSSADLDRGYESNDLDTTVWSDYEMWFGWRWRLDGQFLPGMMKMGDRWAWEGRRFSLLISEVNGTNYNASALQIAHQDADGVVSENSYQNEAAIGAEIAGFSAGVKVTWALWSTSSTHRRGPLDLNAGYADGAVARHADIPVGNGPQDVPGFTGVPWLLKEGGAAANDDWKRYVPMN